MLAATAWRAVHGYAAAEMVNLHQGDKVLIQSGAGGVGTALIQYAKYKHCEIFSTAGTPEKIKHLSEMGVHHPINYRTQDFKDTIRKVTKGKGVNVIFDAVGGRSVKQGFQSLSSGGRIVCFGAAGMNDTNIIGKLKAAVGFGIYHPLMFMMASKSMIGINMLRIADDHPSIVQRCLEAVMKLKEQGVFDPGNVRTFPVD
ncbi:MAG: zinc-binding dehydrogenase, partial [Ferruginibacter sp.]